GCTDTLQATVNVNALTYLVDNISICNYDLPFTWHGQTFNAGGNNIGVHHSVDANGCTVETTLNLIVNQQPTIDFTVQNESCLPALITGLVTTSNPNSNCVWTMNGSSITGD